MRHRNESPEYRRLRDEAKSLKPTIASRDGWKCWLCGDALTPSTATVDHRIPLSLGGTSDVHNLFLSCGPCNNEKGRSLPKELSR